MKDNTITPAKYRWKITRDRLADADAPEGSYCNAKGLVGPSNASDSVSDNPTRFAMYDDDEVCYYEGVLYGNFDGLEPLDDFGTGNAGCTGIKIGGQWV